MSDDPKRKKTPFGMPIALAALGIIFIIAAVITGVHFRWFRYWFDPEADYDCRVTYQIYPAENGEGDFVYYADEPGRWSFFLYREDKTDKYEGEIVCDFRVLNNSISNVTLDSSDTFEFKQFFMYEDTFSLHVNTVNEPSGKAFFKINNAIEETG